jgi:hypothetical protein
MSLRCSYFRILRIMHTVAFLAYQLLVSRFHELSRCGDFFQTLSRRRLFAFRVAVVEPSRCARTENETIYGSDPRRCTARGAVYKTCRRKTLP